MLVENMEKNMDSKKMILEVDSVVKNFGGVKALKSANFNLYQGEVNALIGENGAGKSTMMNIIGGLLQPNEGQIRISGERTHLMSSTEAQSKGITFIHQELTLFPELDVMSNIFIEEFSNQAYAKFINKSIYYEKTKEILKAIELNVSPHTKISQLGMGERQMVEISRMFTRNTKILMLDEPTSSLTEKEVAVLFKLIRKMTAMNVGVIYISHKLEEIFEISDRITVLRDGETVGMFPTRELDQKSLIRHMIGKGMEDKYPRKQHVVGKQDVLQVENLSSSKLNDISFSIKEGEVVGFAGLLGSGRTELAKAIFGLDPYDAGMITIKGQSIKKSLPQNVIDMGMGFVTENRREEGLILEKSIKENMVLASLKNYVKGRFFFNRNGQSSVADEYIKRLDIKTNSSNQLVKNLSGGNQQKVVLGKWLATKPKVLILDEPTRGIDVGAKHEIYKLVDQLASEGVGIMFVSSEIPEILGVCDSVIIMKNNKVIKKVDLNENVNQEVIMNLVQGGDA